ncbi:MAG: aldo/keto reductase [Actinomycetaceae bacterium]|nr:aldo/keto reductase [Actinomycetaceae bacterium]MDU0970346.1 aldo/keto reductase [Actinomycetaceae bacterium]
MTTLPTLPLLDGGTIPAWGMGTYGHQGPAGVDLFAQAARDGHRLFDTAAQYGNEATVGEGLRASGVPRGDLFVTTKIAGGDQGTGSTRTGLTESLRRLGMDYVDLVLIHWPNPSRGLYVDTWKELVKAREDGLVRHIGVSNFLPQHIDALIEATGVTPVINQIQLHPMIQRKDVRAYLDAHDIRTEAWRPIGFKEHLTDQIVVQNIAAEVGRTPVQVVLRWAVQHGIIPISVSSKPERNRENFALDFELSAEQMHGLDSLDAGDRFTWDPLTHEEW